MKDLIIICKSCAAKLKVTKPSSLGKMLACPKCGTMLEIKAKPKPKPKPKPPQINPSQPSDPRPQSKPNTESTSSGVPLKTVLTETDFDEIDSLLEKQKFELDPFAKKVVAAKTTGQVSGIQKSEGQSSDDLSKVEVKKTSPKERFRAVPGTKSKRDQVQPTGSGPLLPDDQWVSPQSQQRKKTLLITSLVVGGGLMLLASVAAWYSLGDSPITVAKEGFDDANDGIVDGSSGPGDQEISPPVEDRQIDPLVQEQAGADTHQGLDRDNDIDDVTPPELNDSPPPLDDQPLPALAGDHAKQENFTQGNQQANGQLRTDLTPRDTDLSAGDVPAKRGGTSSVRTETGAAEREAAEREAAEREAAEREAAERKAAEREAAEIEAAQLAELLESSGFSSGTMRDIASRHREQQRQGIPKYHIEKSSIELPDLDRMLSASIPRLQYQQAKLSTIINDLIGITGIPITFEPFSILSQHGTINPEITFEIDNTTIGEALDELLTSVGLVKLVDEQTGIVIVAEDYDQYIIKNYSVPQFSFEDAEERKTAVKEFITGTKNLIFPDSWERQPDPARIWVEEEGLKVFNSPVAQFQAQRLIAKVNASFALNTDPLDLDAHVTLQTTSDSINERINQPTGLKHQVSQSLLSLINQLEQQTGVTILADWHSLSQLDWSPQSKVPGTIVESTLKDVLRELGYALGITYVVIDDQTIFLTKFENAAQLVDLEVYHFGQILAGKLNENQALELLNKGIFEELRQPLVRVIYEPKYRSLIVVAPQSIQRKIAEIIKALAEI